MVKKYRIIVFVVGVSLGLYMALIPRYVCVDVVSSLNYHLSYSLVEMCSTKVSEKESRDLIVEFILKVESAPLDMLPVYFSGDKNAESIGYEKFKDLFISNVKPYLAFNFYTAFNVGNKVINVFSNNGKKVILIFEISTVNGTIYFNKSDIEAVNPLLASLALREVDVQEFYDFGYLFQSFFSDRIWFKGSYLRLSDNAVVLIGEDARSSTAGNYFKELKNKVLGGDVSRTDFFIRNDYEVLQHLLANDPSEIELWESMKIKKILNDKDHYILIVGSSRGDRLIQLLRKDGDMRVYGLYQLTSIEIFFRNDIFKI